MPVVFASTAERSPASRLPPADALLLALALALRLGVVFRLALTLPFTSPVIFDEMSFATAAADLTRGAAFTPLVHYWGVPFYAILPQGLLIRLLERPLLTFCAVNYLFDALAIPLVYAFARRLFDRPTALVAAFLTALSPADAIAAIWGFQSSLLAVLAYDQLHRVGRVLSPGRCLLVGVLIGLPTGGVRLAPIVLTAAALWLLASGSNWRARLTNTAALVAGHLLTMAVFLGRLVLDPSSWSRLADFMFAAQPGHRAPLADLPAKLGEFLFSLVLTEPVAAVVALVGLALLVRRRLVDRQTPDGNERFLWFFTAFYALVLAFVITSTEGVGRNPRYFFLFSPLLQIIAARELAHAFAGERLTAVLERPSRPALVALTGAVLSAVIAGVVWRGPELAARVFADLPLSETTTVLADGVYGVDAAHYRDHAFLRTFADYRRRPDDARPMLPIAYYSVVGRQGGVRLEQEIDGQRVLLFPLPNKLPPLDFARLRNAGSPLGPAREFYLLVGGTDADAYLAELARRNGQATVDDALVKRTNRFRILRFPLAPRAHDTLDLSFGAAPAFAGPHAFAVGPGSLFVDQIGFGWQATHTLSPADGQGAGPGLPAAGFDDNEFLVRTPPGRYEIEVVWQSAPDAEIPFRVVGAPDPPAAPHYADGWATLRVLVDAGPLLRVVFDRRQDVVLRSLRLRPTP